MFTGIVRSVGRVAAISGGTGARRLAIDTGSLATASWNVGDSVAVSGVCLTVVALAEGRFDAELSGETLVRTTLGRLVPGGNVNLEPAVTATTALGGHLVTGHVDGIATVRECKVRGRFAACDGRGARRPRALHRRERLGRARRRQPHGRPRRGNRPSASISCRIRARPRRLDLSRPGRRSTSRST